MMSVARIRTLKKFAQLHRHFFPIAKKLIHTEDKYENEHFKGNEGSDLTNSEESTCVSEINDIPYHQKKSIYAYLPILKNDKDLLDFILKNILYEDDDYLVINKPYGTPTLSTSEEDCPPLASVVCYLRSHLKVKKVKAYDDLLRKASGVSVLFKSDEAEKRYLYQHRKLEQFSCHQYIAICLGKPLKKEISRRDYLLKMRKMNNQMKLLQARKFRKNFSFFESLEASLLAHSSIAASTDISLMSLKSSGKHKESIDWFAEYCRIPILGDRFYNEEKTPSILEKQLGLKDNERMPHFLHRFGVWIPSASGQLTHVEAPIPSYFTQALRILDSSIH